MASANANATTSPSASVNPQRIVEQMLQAGFADAQVTSITAHLDEVNIELNNPSLLRSNVTTKLALVGFVNNRKVSTECGSTEASAVSAAIAALFASAENTPADTAHAVSSGQKAELVQGPQQGDVPLLIDQAKQWISWRNANTPKVNIGGGTVFFQLQERSVATSRGSLLLMREGHYGASFFGTAIDGTAVSSFDGAEGRCAEFSEQPLVERFGLGLKMCALEQRIVTAPYNKPGLGMVLLTPHAVADVLNWVINQVSDQALLAGSSLLAKQLHQQAASSQLSIRSRFNGPGVIGFSSEAYVCEPITLLDQGVLKTLLASDYASRKLGLTRTPTPAPRAVFADLSGWEILAGTTPLAQLQAQMSSGALVGRLSMGMPAANGDFSGVLKNSFSIESGRQHTALRETMISANMAQMLNNIVGVSQERIDTGAWCLPWLLIDGANFS